MQRFARYIAVIMLAVAVFCGPSAMALTAGSEPDFVIDGNHTEDQQIEMDAPTDGFYHVGNIAPGATVHTTIYVQNEAADVTYLTITEVDNLIADNLEASGMLKLMKVVVDIEGTIVFNGACDDLVHILNPFPPVLINPGSRAYVNITYILPQEADARYGTTPFLLRWSAVQGETLPSLSTSQKADKPNSSPTKTEPNGGKPSSVQPNAVKDDELPVASILTIVIGIIIGLGVLVVFVAPALARKGVLPERVAQMIGPKTQARADVSEDQGRYDYDDDDLNFDE